MIGARIDDDGLRNLEQLQRRRWHQRPADANRRPNWSAERFADAPNGRGVRVGVKLDDINAGRVSEVGDLRTGLPAKDANPTYMRWNTGKNCPRSGRIDQPRTAGENHAEILRPGTYGLIRVLSPREAAKLHLRHRVS
jgi:hypothetical protein